MTRKRKQASRRGRLAALGLIALVGGAVWLWRAHPEYLSASHWLRARSGRTSSIARPSRPSPEAPLAGRTITVPVYFLRVTDREVGLVAVRRQVSASSPARAALQELISGPLPAGCDRPFPEGVTVRGIKVAHGIVTADFSKELVTRFLGGSSNEGALVYSIVNTLTSLPRVDKAQILVEGKQVESIGGHLDVRGPLAYDGELVRE